MKYLEARTAMGNPQINQYLAMGWEIITASYCQLEQGGVHGGPRQVSYIPHALMGRPDGVPGTQTPAVPAGIPEPVPAQVQEQPDQPMVPDTQTPVASRPPRAPQRSNMDAFTAPPDLGRSEEVMIGVRRR